jgi:hypothetical protein
MVAMSTPQQVSSHPEERVWSHLRKFSEIAQSSVKLGQGSPRERRIRAQPASSSSSNNTAHCTTSTNAREFPREWGSPPSKLSPVKAKLPEGYGVGSVTIRSWIIHRMHDVPVTSFVETRAADSKPNDLLLGSDNAELVSIDASTRRTLRHPDVPWAPDGSCWSSFKMKSERERQERRRQREGASSSQVQDQSVRNSVAPIVPCLLLENFSELLDRREQNRISTPLSTRHLLRELQQRKSVCAVGQVQGDELLNGMESKTTVPVETQCRLSCAVQRPSAAAARLVDRRHSLEQLAPVAHEALLTQRLMRLSSLKKRFKEVCALSDEEKREAAALISQRAQVVLELRRLRSQDRAQQAQCPPRKPPAKAEHDEMRPSFSHSHRAINSLPNGEHLNPAMVRQKSSQRSRPHSTAASRQRLWITTVLHVTALLSFNRIICTEKARQVEAQKRQLAALTIQKVFRSKLIPYYAKQLVNAVATLKPWMADALLRWRQRRLHRSADILRHVLERSRKSNKITACIRAFRQKVIRIQRNIRSFLACTHARVVRLLKLLHVQVGLMPRSAFDSMIDTFEQCIGGNKALLNVSARAKQYPSNEKVIIDRFTLSEICFDLAKQDRAVWRRSPKILTFEDRIGDRCHSAAFLWHVSYLFANQHIVWLQDGLHDWLSALHFTFPGTFSFTRLGSFRCGIARSKKPGC